MFFGSVYVVLNLLASVVFILANLKFKYPKWSQLWMCQWRIREGLVRTGICWLVFELNPCTLGVRRVGRAIDCHPRRKPDLN